jgi:hypothetical protein
MRYQVGITICNCFEVEADNKEEAEQLVRDYTDRQILDDSDFKVAYVEKAITSVTEKQDK